MICLGGSCANPSLFKGEIQRNRTIYGEVNLKFSMRRGSGHLWNPSYYIETIGSISENVIRKYIEAQKRK